MFHLCPLMLQFRAVRYFGPNGNPYINADGYNIVVFPAGAGWGFRVTNRLTDRGLASRRVLESVDAAKLRSFDAMVWLKERGE